MPPKPSPRLKMECKKAVTPQSSKKGPKLPIKYLHACARRSIGPITATVISFEREVILSHLYDKGRKELYMHQVFTSISKIKLGRFGYIYKATSKEDSLNYAIKVKNGICPALHDNEVRILEKIPQNKNSVQYFMAWRQNDCFYIQMELCVTSLDIYLDVYHNIDEPTSWKICIDISLGLQYMHNSNLIHMNLKPANVMIAMDGTCKIGDFGLVFDLNKIDKDDADKFPDVCEGDGRYIAIEVFQEIALTKAADIFSLGLLMLETISDVVLPKSGENWVKLREGVLPECYYQIDFSQGFCGLIEKMLSQDYKLRPTISEILDSTSVLNVLGSSRNGQPLNIMDTWETDYDVYIQNNQLDLVELNTDFLNPEPTTKYNRKSLEHVDTPIKTPLKESNSSDHDVPTEPKSSGTDKAARRLF